MGVSRRIPAATIAVAIALAACSSRPAQTPETGATAAPTCRVGPDGEPVVADRGIGGTGRPERRVADRGIGGTGIIGVITGFGSVCVNGFEVVYDPQKPVSVDGRPDDASVLRVGQFAAIEAASGLGFELHARRLAVRHEVVGPVEAAAHGSGQIRVAGQIVVVPAEVQGDPGARLDDWVAVSGLRNPSGRIVASRIDVGRPGRALIHGRLERGPDGAWRIDGARIQFPNDAEPAAGQLVRVSGTYAGGLLRSDAWEPDLLASDPAAYFGAAVDRLSVEQYLPVGGTGAWLGNTPAGGPVFIGGAGGRNGPAIVNFARMADGTMAPTSLREARGGPVPSAPFTPAPVPGAATLGPASGEGGFGPSPPGGPGRMPTARPELPGAANPGGAGGPLPPAPPPLPARR